MRTVRSRSDQHCPEEALRTAGHYSVMGQPPVRIVDTMMQNRLGWQAGGKPGLVVYDIDPFAPVQVMLRPGRIVALPEGEGDVI